MTETHGYFCPRCLIRWVSHTARGKEYLPCGCGVKTEDAVWLYHQKRAKHLDRIWISYDGWDFRSLVQPIKPAYGEWDEEYNYEAVKQRFLAHVKSFGYSEHIQKILLIAFHNAVYGSSYDYSAWAGRCWRCIHNIGVQRVKCKLGKTWMDISCTDFVLKESFFQKMLQEAEE